MFIRIIFISFISIGVFAKSYLVIPSSKVNENKFWSKVTAIFKTYNKQFNKSYEIIYTLSNRFDYHQILNRTIDISKQGDEIYMIYLRNQFTKKVTAALNKGIKVIVFNTEIPKKDLDVILKADKLKNFYYSSPDDYKAGSLLIKNIHQRLKHLKKINVISLSGTTSSTPSQVRINGMKSYLKKNKDLKLIQITRADWSRKKAKFLARKFHHRHKKIDAYWTASDSMARGVFDYYEEKGIEPPLIAGIDWSEDAEYMINKSKNVISVGGHFLEIAYVMEAVRKNKASGPIEFPTSFTSLDYKNYKTYKKYLSRKFWEEFDFKTFHSFRFN